jgi:hypothetical protein
MEVIKKCEKCGGIRNIDTIPTLGKMRCVQADLFHEICEECDEWLENREGDIYV